MVASIKIVEDFYWHLYDYQQWAHPVLHTRSYNHSEILNDRTNGAI